MAFVIDDVSREDLGRISDDDLIVIRRLVETTGHKGRGVSSVLDEDVMRVETFLQGFSQEVGLLEGILHHWIHIPHQHPRHHHDRTLLSSFLPSFSSFLLFLRKRGLDLATVEVTIRRELGKVDAPIKVARISDPFDGRGHVLVESFQFLSREIPWFPEVTLGDVDDLFLRGSMPGCHQVDPFVPRELFEVMFELHHRPQSLSFLVD